MKKEEEKGVFTLQQKKQGLFATYNSVIVANVLKRCSISQEKKAEISGKIIIIIFFVTFQSPGVCILHHKTHKCLCDGQIVFCKCLST